MSLAITSDKERTLSLQFVYLQYYNKTTRSNFLKFGGKVAQWATKETTGLVVIRITLR